MTSLRGQWKRNFFFWCVVITAFWMLPLAWQEKNVYSEKRMKGRLNKSSRGAAFFDRYPVRGPGRCGYMLCYLQPQFPLPTSFQEKLVISGLHRLHLCSTPHPSLAPLLSLPPFSESPVFLSLRDGPFAPSKVLSDGDCIDSTETNVMTNISVTDAMIVSLSLDFSRIDGMSLFSIRNALFRNVCWLSERDKKKMATGILDLCEEPSVACREPATGSDEINLRLRRGRPADVKDWRRLWPPFSSLLCLWINLPANLEQS
ncbi:hypothetical protein TNCV_1088271 [Trichonephila clavipes]|uniref:Uncharacterized protein n=1 Tax=Trichonephila clavipes TaxID=2585209 RepID=A0A8X6SP68_TRICX|nr:hypothetical protein TNCV_1088271 [Trichonephila clavipes]